MRFKESREQFKEIWKQLKKSFGYVKKQKKIMIVYLVISLLTCIIGVFIPMLSARLILNITDGFVEGILIAAFVLFGLEIFHNISNYISSKASQLIYFGCLYEIQLVMARETLRLKTKEIDEHSSGVFIDRLKNDTAEIAHIFSDLTFSIADICGNIGILLAILIINPYLFFYSIINIIILFWIERKRMRKYYEIDQEWRKLSERNTGFLGEFVRGLRDIRVLNADMTFLHKATDLITTTNNQKYQMREVLRRYRFLAGNIKDVFDLGFILLGVWMIQCHLLTAANLVVLYMYRDRVQNLLNYIVGVIERLKSFQVSAGRVFEVIENHTFEKESFGKYHLETVEGNFECRDVHFAYQGEHEILKGLSFKVKANETVAFVGKSGSGKSTVFSLLSKLYTVDDGSIFIDGVDINELDKDSIRDNMSVITQNPYIFHFSIRDNLRLVKQDLTDEEMIEVCKIARLHDFIMMLPDGYDTMVGEGGITLSGGQRQRLAIARALIKKTEIILFDEATSALDNQTQKEIQEAIQDLKGEYTILMIAHRLSTVMDCHRILVVDDGRVIAEGTHQQLLKNCQLYQELYQSELTV